MSTSEFALSASTRIFFLLYWFFDNLSILSKLNLIAVDSKEMGKKGATCWFIALISTLMLTIRSITLNTMKISSLRRYL